MSTQQALAFGVIALMMAAFIWGRIRYDIVACSVLVLAVALGLVPAENAFFRLQ